MLQLQQSALYMMVWRDNYYEPHREEAKEEAKSHGTPPRYRLDVSKDVCCTVSSFCFGEKCDRAYWSKCQCTCNHLKKWSTEGELTREEHGNMDKKV